MPLRFSSTSLKLCMASVTAIGAVLLALPIASNAKKQKTNYPEPQPGEAVLRTTATLVTVDVVVNHNGYPVTGLPKEAFHVFQDGNEQTIANFEEHQQLQRLAVDKPARRADHELPNHVYTNALAADDLVTVLLLDGLNTLVQDQTYARKQMVEQLREIPGGTRIGIFTLGSSLRLVQSITTDVSALTAALRDDKSAPRPSALMTDVEDLPAEISGNESASDALQNFLAQETAQEADSRVRLTLDAMRQLVKYLSAVPGRKNVIWVSGSFPISLDPDTSNNPFLGQRSYAEQLQIISNEMAAARIAVYPVSARGLVTQPMFSASNAGTSYASGMRGRTGRRFGGGGPGAFARDTSQFSSDAVAERATMQQLAADTGGAALYSNNNLKQAITTVLENGSSYYTLSYTPSGKLKADGKFHRIAVKVPSEDYKLLYRHGYFAKAAELHAEARADLLRPDAPDIRHGAPPSSEILFKTRVLRAEHDVQSTPAGLMGAQLKGPLVNYGIDYSIDVHRVSVQAEHDQTFHGMLELVAIVYDQGGRIINVVDWPLQLTFSAAEYESLKRTGLTLHQEISSPDGPVYLRLAVYDLMTAHLGSLEIAVTGPARPM